jgi:hypothetical protein
MVVKGDRFLDIQAFHDGEAHRVAIAELLVLILLDNRPGPPFVYLFRAAVCPATCVRKYRSPRALKLVVESRAGSARILCCKFFTGIRPSFGIGSPALPIIISNRRAVLLEVRVPYRAPRNGSKFS